MQQATNQGDVLERADRKSRWRTRADRVKFLLIIIALLFHEGASAAATTVVTIMATMQQRREEMRRIKDGYFSITWPPRDYTCN